MNLLYLSNHAAADPLNASPHVVIRVCLIAHLGFNARRRGDLGHRAGFPDSVRQRFLTVDVFAHLHGEDRCMEMVMIRRRDRHRVYFIAHVIEHLAIVAVEGGIRIGVSRIGHLLQTSLDLLQTLCVNDVDERDDFESRFFTELDIRTAFSSCPNPGKRRFFEPFVG